MKQTRYVSVDVETDGPIPGDNSLLAIGAVAFGPGKFKAVSEFYRTMKPRPHAGQDAQTMEWWKGFPDAWAELKRNPVEPRQAMVEFVEWLTAIEEGGKYLLTFIGWPAAWDFMFIYWYLKHYQLPSPFGHSGQCIKTLAAAYLEKPYRQIGKGDLPAEWIAEAPPHDHTALNDAIGQAMIFCRLIPELYYRDV